MPFEAIENVGQPAPAPAVPEEGLRVGTGCAGRNAAKTRYIRIVLGGGLAKSLGFHAEAHRASLSFGTGRDTGKVQIAVDNKDGAFAVKRARNKRNYSLTINARSAVGRFALDFPPFAITRLEAIKPDNGGPRFTVFPASPEMLAPSTSLRTGVGDD